MFEQRRVQILCAIIFAAIIVIVVVLSTDSSSTKSDNNKNNSPVLLERITTAIFDAESTSSNSIVDDMKVAMCAKSDNVIGYNASQEFCKCEANVVSCDFSNFKSERVSIYISIQKYANSISGNFSLYVVIFS